MDRLKDISILHINTAKTWRGGEKQTFYLTSLLHKRGYKSYCICQKDSILQKKLEENQLPHFPVRMRSEFDFIAAFRIADISKKLNTHILHMHTSHAHSIGFLCNLFHKIPVNIAARRVDFRISGHLLNRIKYGFPDKYITVSNAIRDILIECGIPGDKIAAVHSGIDYKDYDSIECGYLNEEFNKIPDLNNKIKIVNVAALTHQKDHETLIKAMSILVKSRNDVVLFIAGEGELENALKKQVTSLKLNDHVFFQGFRDDALSLLKFGDIFVMSSRWEGLGTSIIDAMALGKPVIASRTGGIPELIHHGEDGILVEKEDPEELAEAIIRLIDNDELLKKLSESALKKEKRFSIESTVDRTVEVYRDLMDELIDHIVPDIEKKTREG